MSLCFKDLEGRTREFCRGYYVKRPEALLSVLDLMHVFQADMLALEACSMPYLTGVSLQVCKTSDTCYIVYTIDILKRNRDLTGESYGVDFTDPDRIMLWVSTDKDVDVTYVLDAIKQDCVPIEDPDSSHDPVEHPMEVQAVDANIRDAIENACKVCGIVPSIKHRKEGA